jgi:tetratricopeptide (TPR) repeat protein
LSLGFRPAEQTNADAERLYRRAIEIDPASSEARVRLARLLELRRRYEDSAAQLSQVTANAPDDALGFYAHLFAGRTAQALGRMDEASRHYEEATARFPNAQSALLASSLLAVLRSDRAAARVPIERLGLGTSDSAADPWWAYYLCAGRDSEELLNALWAAVPR